MVPILKDGTSGKRQLNEKLTLRLPMLETIHPNRKKIHLPKSHVHSLIQLISVSELQLSYIGVTMRTENVRIQTTKIEIFIVVVHMFSVHKVRRYDVNSFTLARVLPDNFSSFDEKRQENRRAVVLIRTAKTSHRQQHILGTCKHVRIPDAQQRFSMGSQ